MNISLFHQVNKKASTKQNGYFLRSVNQSNRLSDEVTVFDEKQKSNEKSVTRLGRQLCSSNQQSIVLQNNGLNDEVKESNVSLIEFLHQYNLFIELFSNISTIKLGAKIDEMF